jgi:hypothetical protein
MNALDDLKVVVVIEAEGHTHDFRWIVYNVLSLITLGVQNPTSVVVSVVLVDVMNLFLNLLGVGDLVSILYNISNEFNQINLEFQKGLLIFLRRQVLDPDSKVFDLDFSVIEKTLRELFLYSKPRNINKEYYHDNAVKEHSYVSDLIPC